MGSVDFGFRVKSEQDEIKLEWQYSRADRKGTSSKVNETVKNEESSIWPIKLEEGSAKERVEAIKSEETDLQASFDCNANGPQGVSKKEEFNGTQDLLKSNEESLSSGERAGPIRNIDGATECVNIIRKREKDEDIVTFMAQRKNLGPILKKFKKNDETVALPDDTVYEIIKQSGLTDLPLPDIDPLVRDTMVTRYLISDMLGGSPQDTFPTPREEKIAEHGTNQYMCLVCSFNPFAPQLPGRSGLFFHGNRKEHRDINRKRDGTVYPYFMRVDSNKWHYLGHYELKVGRTLTVEEWKQQSPLCKRTWIKDVANVKGFLPLRAYIRLRRCLQEDDEVKPAAIEDMEFKLEKNKLRRRIPAKTVRQGLGLVFSE